MNRERETRSPVYPVDGFPYTWADIRGGAFSLTPVHWERHTGNPILPDGMNSRAIHLDENTVRVFFGRRQSPRGIYYFDVDPADPASLRNGVIGPILTPGTEGGYDDDWVICPEPVRISEAHWRLYYAAKRREGNFFEGVWTLACADSHDGGQTWRKYEGNPILKVSENEWESGAVGFSSVEKDEKGWRMWYLGTDRDRNALKQVGYATSGDGLAWDRYAGNPVIPVDPDNVWEARAIAVARVIRDGRLYRAWYCCYPQNDTYAIGVAESADGIHWVRSPHNPVMQGLGEGWDGQMTAYPGVVRAGDRYLMWYSGP